MSLSENVELKSTILAKVFLHIILITLDWNYRNYFSIDTKYNKNSIDDANDPILSMFDTQLVRKSAPETCLGNLESAQRATL